jgi:hypothetical protein
MYPRGNEWPYKEPEYARERRRSTRYQSQIRRFKALREAIPLRVKRDLASSLHALQAITIPSARKSNWIAIESNRFVTEILVGQ